MTAYAAFGNNQTQIIVFVSATRFNAGSIAPLFRPYGVGNRWNLNDPYVVDILDRAALETDPVARGELYRHLQYHISLDPPVLNIFWRLNGVVARTGMGGMHLRSDMQYNLRGIFRVVD